ATLQNTISQPNSCSASMNHLPDGRVLISLRFFTENDARIVFSTLTHAPSLPKMAPLMCRNDMQPCGQAEADAVYEWIRETSAGKIQFSILAQENPNFMMRLDELVESISKSWILARTNNPWSLYSEES